MSDFDIGQDTIFITFDIDWAPDAVCRYVVETLERYGVPVTMFVTHQSEYLQSLRDHDLVEVGIHPNYEKKGVEEAVDELLEHYPSAKYVRAHGLQTSTEHLQIYQRKGLDIASDVFLPSHPGLRPTWRFGEGSILSVPFFWEDDNYFANYGDVSFDPGEFLEIEGMKIFNFHPIHVFANTESMDHYSELKEDYHDPDALREHRVETGTEDFFTRLLESDYTKKTFADIQTDG
ncbi:polysaccharide deacetylase WbmS family protein [Halosimplex marinum]|uniref:polysaccharide deacetylase WbmS family protein n=1 Tax=Halosimplex marinum TaxID=3396620 RepID=UPI003F5433CF